MHDQDREIRGYFALVNLLRQQEWLLRTPLLGRLQHLFYPRHTIYPRNVYLDRVMAACGTTPQGTLKTYEAELLANAPLRRDYLIAVEQKKISRKYGKYEERIVGNTANVVNYYALIRERMPDIVVETGTASGSMTSWILAALEANGKGKLISIDLPPTAGTLTMDLTIQKADIGFLIPKEFHHRWDYIVGDAKVVLPKLLAENAVDIFIHDSLHTRTHMHFEYNTARALMKAGTLILSDDILWNSSFFEFIRSHHLTSLGCISNPNLGFTVNTFDNFEREIGTEIVRTSH